MKILLHKTYATSVRKEKNKILCAFLIARILNAKKFIATHRILPKTSVNLVRKNGRNYKNSSIFYQYPTCIDQRWSVVLIITIKRYLNSSAKILAHKIHFVAVDVITN